MTALSGLIDDRELDVNCRRCGRVETRTLSWLSAQRHMNCPVCAGVIVLDTSDMRRAIAHQRRQLSALHEQMTKLLGGAHKIVQHSRVPPQTAPLATRLDLAIARKHPDAAASYPRLTAAVRRVRR